MLVRTPVGLLDGLRRIPPVASVLYFEGVVDSEVCREQETLWVFEQTHNPSGSSHHVVDGVSVSEDGPRPAGGPTEDL